MPIDAVLRPMAVLVGLIPFFPLVQCQILLDLSDFFPLVEHLLSIQEAALVDIRSQSFAEIRLDHEPLMSILHRPLLPLRVAFAAHQRAFNDSVHSIFNLGQLLQNHILELAFFLFGFKMRGIVPVADVILRRCSLIFHPCFDHSSLQIFPTGDCLFFQQFTHNHSLAVCGSSHTMIFMEVVIEHFLILFHRGFIRLPPHTLLSVDLRDVLHSRLQLLVDEVGVDVFKRAAFVAYKPGCPSERVFLLPSASCHARVLFQAEPGADGVELYPLHQENLQIPDGFCEGRLFLYHL